jgi:hypothetical protein
MTTNSMELSNGGPSEHAVRATVRWSGLHTFADAVIVGLSQRNPEITYGFSTRWPTRRPPRRRSSSNK